MVLSYFIILKCQIARMAVQNTGTIKETPAFETSGFVFAVVKSVPVILLLHVS